MQEACACALKEQKAHQEGHVNARPFVTVACSTISECLCVLLWSRIVNRESLGVVVGYVCRGCKVILINALISQLGIYLFRKDQTRSTQAPSRPHKPPSASLFHDLRGRHHLESTLFTVSIVVF